MLPITAPLDAVRLQEGLAFLAVVDPDLGRVVAAHGPPSLRVAEAGFGGLLRSIVGQQLSIRAAHSIWQKLCLRVEPLTPEAFLAAEVEVLKAAGLSRAKILYSQALARAVVEGTLDFGRIAAMDDEAAIDELVKAKGIGRWTAEIYLMFALGRADIFPSADLGLMVAVQSLKGLARRPTPKEMIEIGLAWRPWRSVATLVLWHYRHAMPDWG